MLKQKILPLILCVLTVLMIAAIFRNSLQSGSVSNGRSETVVSEVQPSVKSVLKVNSIDLAHLVRKSAHVIEFGALGALLMCTTLLLVKRKQYKLFPLLFVPLFFALFIGNVDEFIQTFSVGRTSLVADVFIDFSGAVLGMLLVLGVFFLHTVLRKRKRDSGP